MATSKDNLPSDYEECGDCHFDHTYEPVEALRAHCKKLDGRRYSDFDPIEVIIADFLVTKGFATVKDGVLRVTC